MLHVMLRLLNSEKHRTWLLLFLVYHARDHFFSWKITGYICEYIRIVDDPDLNISSFVRNL